MLTHNLMKQRIKPKNSYTQFKVMVVCILLVRGQAWVATFASSRNDCGSARISPMAARLDRSGR